ncbi:MAG: response regulator transcription factor [Sphingobium sp.]|nr:response regulator transcription factor [Sphingobium sp.]
MNAPLVLIADVQPDMRARVRETLEESGFQTRDATSADAIWRAVEGTDLSAVVLDTALRGPQGTDLCRGLRERSDVPIILVGAHSTEVDRVVGLELGADDFLTKPYSARELLARLRAVLRRGRTQGLSPASRRQEARFDGWLISFPRRELHDPAGDLVELTGAEFDLLTVLTDQPQRVIARDRLIELSGSRPGESSDRSVDVLISRLRRKLTYGRVPAPIVTVRGAGYMFSAAVEHG